MNKVVVNCYLVQQHISTSYEPMSSEMENITLVGSSTKMNKLCSNNFHSWSYQLSAILAQQKLKRHIDYATFFEWYAVCYKPSQQELYYREDENEIIKNEKLSDDERKAMLKDLRKHYFADISLWSKEKQKLEMAWDREMEAVLGILQGSIDQLLWNEVKKLPTPLEMYARLKELTLISDTGHLILLYKQFFRINFMKGETLIQFYTRACNILDKLEEIDEAIPPHIACGTILAALPDESFEVLSSSLHQVPKKDLTLELLRQKFSMEDARRGISIHNGKERMKGESGDVRANASLTKERRCFKCKKSLPPDHPKQYSMHDKCFALVKEEREVRELKERDEKEKRVEAKCVSVFVGTSAVSESSKNPWYLDSACTAHLTNELDDLTNTRRTDAVIRGPLGESSSASIAGDVNFSVSNDEGEEKSVCLSDAFYSGDLQRKLMSLRRLTKAGFDVVFKGDECFVFKGEELVMTGGVDESELYRMSHILFGDEAVISTNVATHTPKSQRTVHEWHEKLGHLSFQEMINLSDLGALDGFRLTEDEKRLEFSCKVCDHAKMPRKKFSKSKDWGANLPGDVIHTDVCGKISPESIGGKRYFVTVIT